MNSALEQLHRWIFLMQQVHEARHYLDRTLALGHPAQFQSIDGMLEFLLYFRGTLNSYAKCFVSSGKGKMQLNPAQVFLTSSELLVHHSTLIDLRHKYVAHCDDNEFEQTVLTTGETNTELIVGLQYNFSFPFDRLYELRDLITNLESYVVHRHALHRARLEQTIGKTIRIGQGEQEA